MEIWQIWLAVALAFLILEIFTSGFAVACFSIGCVFGSIASACHLSTTWQFTLFAVGSILTFVLVRPFVLKMIEKKSKKEGEVLTNADSIIGRTAVVSEKIEKGDFGRVKLDGDDWKAQSIDGEAIEVGTKVEIVSRESIILTVKQN